MKYWNTTFMGTKVLILFSILIFTVEIATAQENSPYTRYGVGDVRSTSVTANQGMGGLGAATRDNLRINFTNPASYSKFGSGGQYTTFETGLFTRNMWISGEDSIYNTGYANLDYLAFGIPLKERWGMSFGLMPYSRVNYNFSERINDAQIGIYENQYSGRGALYQLWLGSGYEIKGFSFGANIALAFGKIDYTKAIAFPDSLESLNTRNTSNLRSRGFFWNLGLQYSKKLDNELVITAGIYGNANLKLNTDLTQTWERYVNSFGVDVVLDTVIAPVEAEGKITLPGKFGAGLTVGKEGKFVAGFDFEYNLWSDFDNNVIAYDPLQDSWVMKIGGEITPDYKAISKYGKRMTYRAGAHFGKSQLNLNGQDISDFGITFGFALPVSLKKRSTFDKSVFSKVNFAFDIGKRGTTQNNLIKENYIKASIGFTLSDKWFIKRKFD